VPVDERTEIAGDRRGDAVLACTTTGNYPQLAHTLFRRVALGHGAEERELLGVHLERKSGLQDRFPRRPARAGEPPTEQIGVIEALDDVDHRVAALT
jgi:hypothetical protein